MAYCYDIPVSRRVDSRAPQSDEPLEGSPLGSPNELASTARAVRSMFETVTPRYDFLNHFLSAGLDLYWRRTTALALRAQLQSPESVALDLCCGTGDLAFALRRTARGQVLAADFCRPMLERARQKASANSHSVRLLGADALDLPLPDHSVDAVASAFGFRNLANYALGLREMMRVLKPGGSVAILEFSRVQWPIFATLFRFYFAHVLPRVGDWISGTHGAYGYLHESASRFPEQEALATIMRRAGFTDVQYRNLAGGVAALHCGRKAGTGHRQ
jgi:demethylmenaquinone methyltransferase / 2-methoxy-6-polyprenyl-1,4-benzoquinol methylase